MQTRFSCFNAISAQQRAGEKTTSGSSSGKTGVANQVQKKNKKLVETKVFLA